MWLWRRIRDESLGFPQPVYIAGRRYFSDQALDAFDERLRGAAGPAAA
jgi:hypothetical protein